MRAGEKESAAGGGACPCGTGPAYVACCGPLHAGEPAPDCERLMRSRFSAYAQRRPEYLLRTWHPSTRPTTLDLEGSPNWASLQILSSTQQAGKGQVKFRAIYRDAAVWQFLEETSDFTCEEGRWLYVAGTTTSGALKPGRNDPCPCGSGRKHKACCI